MTLATIRREAGEIADMLRARHVDNGEVEKYERLLLYQFDIVKFERELRRHGPHTARPHTASERAAARKKIKYRVQRVEKLGHVQPCSNLLLIDRADEAAARQRAVLNKK